MGARPGQCKSMEKSLNGTYTRMLRKALNVHWSSHTANAQLYGNLPRVSDKIASRRLQLAGHCHRHPELSTYTEAATMGTTTWTPWKRTPQN